MSDAPQTRTDSLTPPPNGRSAEVEALTAALAEARLKQTLLEQVIAQVPVGVFVADAKTGLPQLVNQAGIDLLGRGLNPHRRKDESAEVYPNYLPGTQQLYPVQDLPMVRTMSTGEPAHAEIDVQRPEGRMRVDMTTSPVRDAAGRVVSAVAVIQPVTHKTVTETSPQELEEARGFLEAVIESLPVGLFMKDADELRFVRWNKANEDLIGLKRDTVLGKNDTDFFPTEEAKRFIQNDREVMAGGQLLDIPEETVQTTHRGARILHTRKVPILGADGRPKYLLGISEDITERKQAEEALREREEDLAALLEFSPEAIGVVNTQTGLFENVNLAAERLYGLPRDELVKVGPAQMSPEFQPDGRPSLDAALEKIGAALQGGRPVFDWTHRNAAGQLIPCEIRLVGLAAPHQHLVRFSATDITERKQAEAALAQRAAELQDATAFLDSVIDNLPTMLFVKEAQDLRFIRWNKAGEDLLGFPRAAMVGKNDHDFFPKEEADFFTAKDREVLQGRQLVDIPEEPIQTAHRGQRLLHTRKIPILDAHGQPKYLLGISEDITERKQAEAALRTNQGQLSQALQIAKLAYWEYKPEQDQFLFNDQFYALFHTTAEQEGGYVLSSARYAERFVYPEDLPVVGAEIEMAMKSTDRHYSRQLDHRIQYADGGVGYMSVSINIERDEQGHILRYYGANQDITASKQAEAISAKRAAELEVVAQVGTAAATILDPHQLLQTVVDLTKSNFKLYHAHVYTLNETSDTLELAAGAGEVGHKMVSQGWRISGHHEHSLVARAARTRQGVIANDVREAPDFLPNPLLPNTRSEMALPIIASDRLLGVLDVQADVTNHFTNEDLRIQSILATQIAVALQNARQFAEARRLADRETLVNAISQQIQNATTVESALQIAARELGRALGAQRTIVQLGQSDKSPR